jgi:hypothetical protein
MRAEHEAGEEDDRDDEYRACHDANPRGDHVQPARPAAMVALCDRGRGGRASGCSGADGSGSWFGRRRCFTHVPDGRRDCDAPLKNRL